MTHYLVTSTFIDFQEDNRVLLSRVKFRPDTIQKELLKRYRFFESASCEVSYISPYEAKHIGIKQGRCNSLEELIETFESIEIYKQNKRQ